MKIIKTPRQCDCSLISAPDSFKPVVTSDEDRVFSTVSALTSGDYSSVKLILVSVKPTYHSTSTGKNIVYIVAADATGSVNGAIFEDDIARLKIADYVPGQFVQFINISVRPNRKEFQRWASSELQLKFTATSAIIKLNDTPPLPDIIDLKSYIGKSSRSNNCGKAFIAFVDGIKSTATDVVVTILDHSVDVPAKLHTAMPMGEMWTNKYLKRICFFKNIHVQDGEISCKNQKSLAWIDNGSEHAVQLAKALIRMNYIDDYEFPVLSVPSSSSNTVLTSATSDPVLNSSSSDCSVSDNHLPASSKSKKRTVKPNSKSNNQKRRK